MTDIPRGILLALTAAAAACMPAAAADPLPADGASRVFDPRFRTLRLVNPDVFTGMPVIRLGTDDRLTVSFDELGDDYSYLQYRILHCNADWQRSQLVESEYLDGFNIADITDYAFSSNTYVHYVNYSLTIPDGRMSPTVSGNYLLQVFPQDDPDRTILQIRFCVSENAVAVGGEATSLTDRDINTDWQQVNLSVATSDFPLKSPFTDVFLVVSQNGRPDATRTIMRPQQMKGRTLVYEHIPDLIFPAANEYRRFETVRANYPGMNVDSVGFGGRNYHAWLRTDSPRAFSPYSFDATQNGRFMIDEYNSTDPDLGADYITVHFELDHPQVMNADIYVDGQMTLNGFSEANRMKYDPDRRLYTLELPLKQGSYNYQYVAVPKGKTSPADHSLVEGNKYETRNEYQVYVYLREPGSRADRLIGTAQLFPR
ncbi:MAG: DUF5103 domain-containing protein [Muribaculaceae bacterium]|nr:DUF5103 domain-containing protein [Muribaculaceae bacterium]